MHILKLTMENFGVYEGKHTLDLKKGVTFITGLNKDNPEEADSNASGKTTILHAISWCLFGKPMHGVSQHKLMTHDCTGKMEVSLHLTGQHTITRTITKKNSACIYENPTDGRLIGDVDKCVNPKICERLGITYQLFQNALYLAKSSGSVQFLQAKPADRSRILGELVDDSVFQEAAKILKMSKTSLEHRYSKFTHEVAIRQDSIGKCLTHIIKLEDDMSLVREREKNQKSEVDKQIKQMQRDMHELSAKIIKTPSDTMEQLEQLRVACRRRLLENQEGLSANLPLPRVKQGVPCPTCFQGVDYDALQHLDKLNQHRLAKTELLRKEQVTLTRELQSLEARQQAVRDWEARQVQDKAQLKEWQFDLAHLQSRYEEVSQGSAVIQSKIAALRERITEETTAIESVKKQALEIAQETHVTSKLVTIMQSDLRNLLFDQIRGTLEAATEQYIRTIAGDMVSVEFPNTTSTGREKFEINLLKGVQNQDLSCFSEGEAWRASFAILLVLRDTLMNRSKCKLKLMLVDDPLGILDNTGISRFTEVLHNLATDSQILVTVPRSEGISGERVVNVVKEKGRARLSIT